MEIVTKADQLFIQGQLHMKNKLRYFGCQAQKVIKYVISKMRLYKQQGFFESNSRIAENTGVCIKTVQNAIRRGEELCFWIVSTRHETTLNNRKRQTTNLVQLLSYTPIEIVKNVVSKVRTVTSNLVQKVSKQIAPTLKKHAPRQRFTRIEVVPSWLNQPEEVLLPTPEEQLAFDALQQRLREKYRKNKT